MNTIKYLNNIFTPLYEYICIFLISLHVLPKSAKAIFNNDDFLFWIELLVNVITLKKIV